MNHDNKMKGLFILLAIAIAIIIMTLASGCEVLKSKHRQQTEASNETITAATGTDTIKGVNRSKEGYTRETFTYYPDSNLIKALSDKQRTVNVTTPIQYIRERGTREEESSFEQFKQWYMDQKDTEVKKEVVEDKEKKTDFIPSYVWVFACIGFCVFIVGNIFIKYSKR